jgi:hypothetical protein
MPNCENINVIIEQEDINVTIDEGQNINVTLEAGVTQNGGRVKVSNEDTTADYLEEKLVAGEGVTLTKLNVGGDEQLEINASNPTIEWGEITGTLSNQTDLQDELNLKFNSSDFNSTFDSRLATKTTDDLTEGSNNLYDKTVVLNSGTEIQVTGTYPNFTINSTATGVTDHSLLTSLDYASAGHTGFEPTLTKGNLIETTSSILVITNGANSVIGTGTTIKVNQATSSTDGYLSSSDWNTFNNKQNDLGYTPEDVANKSTSVFLGTSDILYPTQNAVKTYVDNKPVVTTFLSLTDTPSSYTGYEGQAVYVNTTGDALVFQPAVSSDEKVKISVGDSTAGYLADKLLGGNGITFIQTTGNEVITVLTNDSQIDHNALLNTHNLTSEINHNTITNTHNLTSDINHNSILNTHNLTSDINHNTITNSHNLTSDIDHSLITNLNWANANHTIDTNLEMNNYSVNEVASIQFNTTSTPLTNTEGLLQWNATDGTLDLGMNGGDITQQIGQELFIKVRNASGSLIPNGTPVYFNGRQGNRPKIYPAKADSETTCCVEGVTTQDIADGTDGFITTFGYVRQIKTDYSGTGDWGTTWAEGDKLYVSKDVAGQLTNIEPSVPHHSDIVGEVGIVGALGIGSIFVRVQRHTDLTELSDVNGTLLITSGQIPVWNQSNEYFDFDKNINNYITLTSAATIYVPYTGATQDVDLGGYSYKSDYGGAVFEASNNFLKLGFSANSNFWVLQSNGGDLAITHNGNPNVYATNFFGGIKVNYDNSKVQLGSDNDAGIYYNGTDLIINPKQIGSGSVNILGDLEASGYGLFDSTNHTAKLATDVDNAAGIFDNKIGGITVSLAGTSAGTFNDGTNLVSLGDQTYAINSTGDVLINGTTHLFKGTTITLDTPIDGARLSNHPTGSVPLAIATTQYVDNILGDANALVYKGTIDCSTNPNYPSADSGHLYIVSIAGKIGGALGENVEVGDMLICNTDSTPSGDQATVGIYWNIIQKNIDGAVTGPSSSTDGNIALFNGATGKVIKDSGTNLSNYLTTATAALTYLKLDGSNDPITGDVTYNDNVKQYFGTGNDASIYYDGTNTYFNTQEVGTGNLLIPNGKVGIGTISPSTELQVASTLTSSPRGIMSSQHSTGPDGARFYGRKSRGTNASPTTIVSGDMLTRWVASGYDGTNYLEMGAIDMASEGTIGTNRIPTRLSLYTATNANPSVLTERMRIDSAGLIQELGGGLQANSLAGYASSVAVTDINGKFQDTSVTITSAPSGGSMINVAEYSSDPSSGLVTGDIWVVANGSGSKLLKYYDGTNKYSVELTQE